MIFSNIWWYQAPQINYMIYCHNPQFMHFKCVAFSNRVHGLIPANI